LTDMSSLIDNKGKLRIVVETQSSWQFSSSFLEHPKWQVHGGNLTPYKSILLKDESEVIDPNEYAKIESFLKKSTLNTYHISKIFAVKNNALENAFTFFHNALQEKFRTTPALFKKETWKQPQNSLKEWTYGEFKKLCEQMRFEGNNSDVPIIPLFHGTSQEVAWKIIQTGFTTVATLDDGFYGRGIYFTSNLEYASYYSGLATKKTGNNYILVTLVIPGNIYPVTEAPNSPHSLKGKGAVDASGYQSHYVCVNGHDSIAGKFEFPCNAPVFEHYDELVIFQDVQALPKYLIELKDLS